MKKKLLGLSGLFSKLKKAGKYNKYWKCGKCDWLNPIYVNVCWKCKSKNKEANYED